MKQLIRAAIMALACATAAASASHAAESYAKARARLIASGLKPAQIPRGGEFDQCGSSGEKALCKRYPELVNCVGMGAAANTCRMVFVTQDGRFYVVSAYGWDTPKTMTFTAGAWANATDTKAIKNIIARKPEISE